MIAQFQNVTLSYGHNWSISGVNLCINEGDFLAIVGPNGSGKTTLMKAVLGILKPKEGELVRKEGIRFGHVPQRQHIDEIYPLTAYEIALMGRYALMGPLSRPSHKDREMTLKSLEHVGIQELADTPYRNLSGGQRQRVLIARALAGEPNVLMLDEPTNDMDIASESATMNLIYDIHMRNGLTVVMISHMLNVVAGYARTIALLNAGGIVVGPSEQILCATHLSSMYATAVDVAEVSGRRVVLTGGIK